MYFLITKPNYEEEIIHSDTVISIVPNGYLVTVITKRETSDALFVRGINDNAMKQKCLEWIEEIWGDENGIPSSN